MNPVEKAVWYIESHFTGEISLDDIAAAGGLTRFTMARTFPPVTGMSPVQYLRARRLSEAARSLANGASDILTVALDTGYGSHEAFTRAFRDQFGRTPEQVRADGHLKNLNLQEPIDMDRTPFAELAPPRFVDHPAFLVAGLCEHFQCEDPNSAPAMWQRFTPYLGNIPTQRGDAAYGVLLNGDDTGRYDYMCGVEVSDFSELPPELKGVRIAPQRYVVFSHSGHISEIKRVFATIWGRWLPESGEEVADAPHFERYGAEFDGATGNGGYEIWIPVTQ